MPGMDALSTGAVIILGLPLPAWIVFGLADWNRHRKTSIETTSGWRESILHVLLVGEAAVAVLAALYFEINALILAVCIAAFLVHEATTALDVGYAVTRREVSALEQRIHDYLTAIPFSAVLLLCATHPAATLSLFGLGNEAADFSLRVKSTPLPSWYLIGFLCLSALNGLAYGEEFLRCLRRVRTDK